MNRTPEQRRRRQRMGGVMFCVGIVLLFVASWAFPEGLIHVARASAGPDAVEMSARGWFTAIFGSIALVLSAVLIFLGFGMRQANGETASEEDRMLDEAWGEETMTDYDLGSFHPTRYGPRD
ncbi:hypothetical protein FCK90_01060 [Kocuria coralli]|uniref:Uncharacterized protein n=1 Tax=Kocuria coralli TaxID=1461025 RepID=A0A5J5L259_9MICC|nr:hypothetical protein [Kocuria coralli]KAA9395638.1 hypothetical protein FCK90_01060 [Kocuria coralli]